MLDLTMFPHVADGILGACDFHDLLTLRQTSRAMCDRVDTLMTAHMTVNANHLDTMEPHLTTPLGVVPVLKSCVGQWNMPDRLTWTHKRVCAALSRTTTLDITSILAASERLAPTRLGTAEPFANLQCVRLYPMILHDYTSHQLAFSAPKVVVFGAMNYHYWRDPSTSQLDGMVKFLPTSVLPRGTRKLVINITGEDIVCGVDEPPGNDMDAISLSLTDVVFIFDRHSFQGNGQWRWGFPNPSSKKRMWFVMFILHFLGEPLSNRSVTFVDFDKIDFNCMFLGEPRSPNAAALTAALHLFVDQQRASETGTRSSSFSDGSRASELQQLHGRIDSAVHFVSLSDYAGRVGWPEVELESRPDVQKDDSLSPTFQSLLDLQALIG